MNKYNLQMSKNAFALKIVFIIITVALIVSRSFLGPIINSSIKSFDDILLNAILIIIVDILIGVATGIVLDNKGNLLIIGIIAISMIILILLPFVYVIIPDMKDSFIKLLNTIELSSLIFGVSLSNFILNIPKRK